MGRSCRIGARRKNFRINPIVVMSAVEVRQGIEAQGDELWLDASARDALGFAVMARVRTERPMPSPAAPLTPPLVREANHAERNEAAAISEMMPEGYER